MNQKEIRYKQRFSNFEKAFLQLQTAVGRFDELDDLAKEGMVQRFEYTFELAWKTLKDFIESKGELERSPRDVIKKSFQLEIINDGEKWLEMLENRNLMAHTYNENTFVIIVKMIKGEYFTEIKKLIEFFKKEIEK